MSTPPKRERRNPTGPTAETVGINVQRVRTDLGMTQNELASALANNGHPIPVSSIGRIESGHRRVEVDDLMALAIALNVSPLALLLPDARSPYDVVNATTWDTVQATHLWGYCLGIYDPIDPYDENGYPTNPPIADRSFPWWAEQELRAFFSTDQNAP